MGTEGGVPAIDKTLSAGRDVRKDGRERVFDDQFLRWNEVIGELASASERDRLSSAS